MSDLHSSNQFGWAPESACLASLLNRTAPGSPKATCIAAPGRDPLSYEGLVRQVHEAVRRLNELGVGRNDRVAIVLPNGPEMAVAFLAVASCATAAPLNPNYRPQEFEFYLTDLRAKALVVLPGSNSPAPAVARAMGVPILELVPEPSSPAGTFTLAGLPAGSLSQGGFAPASDVALVLHTSGTTSRPKIVPLTHRNLCCSAENVRRTLALTPADRCLNVMPLFHIHGLVAALLASLAAGASVVCSPGFDAARFFEWLEGFQPTWYTAVPTMHQAILDRARSRRASIAGAPLRFVRSSSAELPPAVMTELETLFGVPVIEAYGMTEAAHQMASNPLPPARRKPGSVGIPAGPQVAIMDGTGALLSAGKVGEIVIRGANVAGGYENNPAANASAFTHGWFRTGDQGYVDAEGYLFITGRIKELINRGGEKISPREIDEVLLKHPAIAQAAAFAVPHPTLGEEVAVAVVSREQARLSVREIQDFAARHLASYKVPRTVAIVAEIPKGPTGKIQRVGLAERLADALRMEYMAPRDGWEALLADMWQEILRVPRLGIHDNFFAAGGDSIRGMQVLARVREIFQVELPAAAVFQHPTVEQFAQEVTRLADPVRLGAILKIVQELQDLPDTEVERLLGKTTTPDERKVET